MLILLSENIPGTKFARCQITRFYPWCQIVCGVKSSTVSNCPRCQIVQYKIVRGVKLSAVSNCLWCQIVLGSKASLCCPRVILFISPLFHWSSEEFFYDQKTLKWGSYNMKTASYDIKTSVKLPMKIQSGSDNSFCPSDILLVPPCVKLLGLA